MAKSEKRPRELSSNGKFNLNKPCPPKKAKLSLKPGGIKKATAQKPEVKPKPAKLTNKEAHAKIKKLRNERREKDRSHYSTTVEMKRLWEDLRKHDLPKDERFQLCGKIMSMVRGKERDFVFAHDTARVFQTLCKYAPQSIRSELFTSLKESLLEMVKSKYSVFFVRSLLRRGTKEEKNYIIETLMSHARRLIKNKTAGPVVEFAYNEYANSKQRLAFSQQFYGPSFTLLSSTKHQPLSEVLKEKPEKKPLILKFMKDSLESIVQKESLNFTFVHNLLYEYFTYADVIEKQAMAECLQEHVPHIVHTREGAKAAIYTVWYSSAKGRKVVIKQIKPYLEKLLKEEYGHQVLFAVFDAVDDTKFVAKLVVSTLIEKIPELLDNKWSRHVIVYLLSRRNPSDCNKEVREFLSLGDENPYSKKDTDLRQKELCNEFSPAIVKYATENTEKFIADSQLILLLGIIAQNASSEKVDLYKSIFNLYNTPYAVNSQHPLDSKPLRVVINKLLRSAAAGATASEIFMDCLSEETLKSFIASEPGAFLLSNIASASKDKCKQRLSKYKSLINKQRNAKHKELLFGIFMDEDAQT